MTRQELRDTVEKVRKVAEHTKSEAYCFAIGKDGKVEVRVDTKGEAFVTDVNDAGVPIGERRRIGILTRV